MSVLNRKFLLGAAVTGLVSVSASVYAADKAAPAAGAPATTKLCVGANGCKGKGGCKSATNECAGKNGCGGHKYQADKDGKCKGEDKLEA